MEEVLGVKDGSVFSSRGLRRAGATLAHLRDAGEDEADALGDWEGVKSSKSRIRYSEVREDKAKETKLLHVKIVQHMVRKGKTLTWGQARVACMGMNVEKMMRGSPGGLDANGVVGEVSEGKGEIRVLGE